MMNLQDLISRLTSWKSTAIGIAMAAIVILKGFGIVGEEVSEGAESAANAFWDGVVSCMAGLAGVIGLFSKKDEPVV